MADKVKVNVTGSVDLGEGPLELGVYQFEKEAADRIVKAGAGVIVKDVPVKQVKTEDAKPGSIYPTDKNTVPEIAAWLDLRGIDIPSGSTKSGLLQLVEAEKTKYEQK